MIRLRTRSQLQREGGSESFNRWLRRNATHCSRRGDESLVILSKRGNIALAREGRTRSMKPAENPLPGSNVGAPSAKPHSYFRDVPWLWRDVLMAFAPQLVITAAARLQPVAVGRVIAGHWVPLLLLQQLWMVGYTIWAARRRSGMLPAFSPWRVWSARSPLATAHGSRQAFILMVVAASVVASVDRKAATSAEGWMPYVGAASRAQLVGFMVIALIGAPIAEELCFRGLLYNKLRQKLPGFVAVLVQAALFGLSHSPLGITLVYATSAVGLAFGLVYQWRKTLLAPILMHSSVNAMGTALLLASMRPTRPPLGSASTATAVRKAAS